MLAPISPDSPATLESVSEASQSTEDMLIDIFQAVVITVVPALILSLTVDADFFEDKRIIELFYDL